MWQKILELDQQLFLFLNGQWSVFWDWFFYIVSAIPTWLPLYAAIVYFSWRKWGWKRTFYVILFTLIALGLADWTASFFKTVTPKFRPTHNPDIKHLVHTVNGYVGGLYGTVSGHAATSFAVATFISGVFQKKWVTWAMFFWAALVAFSRIYLGVHFPMDIIFGTIAGILIGRLCYWQYSKIKIPADKQKSQ